MANIKLTKTELRAQQIRYGQLQRYLPTLQLKKAMLQAEVGQAQLELEHLIGEYLVAEQYVKSYAPLLTDSNAADMLACTKVRKVEISFENIAGVEIPSFHKVVFEDVPYGIFVTPAWTEAALQGVRELIEVREKIKVVKEKKKALEKELRAVSIRVNLFEKIMIPRALANIKKIKIFLGDVQLAAVSTAKVSKKKLAERETV